MRHRNHSYRLLASGALILLSIGLAWPSETGENTASSVTGINVLFKLDPRLATGVYGGERWVSPPTYVTTSSSVEVRVQGVDANGSSVHMTAEWIPADPGIVTVSPAEGEQVKITVIRPGETSVKIRSKYISRELAIKAISKGDFMQVEIAPGKDVRIEGVTPPVTSPPNGNSVADLSPDTRALETAKDKLSYSLGANLGAGLRRESIEVDSDLIIQGLKDALSEKAMLLTQHEITATLASLKTELTSKRITSAAEKINAAKQLAVKNKKEGEEFLAKNKTKDDVVSLDSGLQYKVLKAGDGKKPEAGDMVVCRYRGTFLDGTEFDSSPKTNEPAIFPLGKVIKGWNEALQLMPVGSKWQLFIPSDLAYGERGAKSNGIGPNATLIFEVELISFKKAAANDRQTAKN